MTPPEPTRDAPVVHQDASGPAGGVIHDIGYQHHTGPRLGRGYIVRSLFAESTRGAYGIGRSARSKVLPMLLLAGTSIPALIIVVVTAVTGVDQLLADYTSYILNLQLVVAIYVAGQAPALVSRDLRFGVVALYFSRPLERLDYVVAKYAALATATLVLTATPLLILFVGALVSGLPLGEQVPDLLRALAGAGLVSLVLAGIGLVIAAVTPRRGLGVAAVMTVLLVLAGVQGVAQQLAVDQGADTLATYLGVLSPFTLVEGVQAGLLGADPVLPATPTTAGVGLVYLLVAGLMVAGCSAGLLLRYRKVSSS